MFVVMKATLCVECVCKPASKRESARDKESGAGRQCACVHVCQYLFPPTAKQPAAFSVWLVYDEVNQS